MIVAAWLVVVGESARLLRQVAYVAVSDRWH